MSTTGDKAKRATVAIGPLSVDGFQMPDGSYRMSISGTAESVGLTARNAFDFLRSKAAERLLGGGYTGSVSEVEVESAPDQARGQTRIQAIPLNIVSKYWLWQSYRGNKQAFALVDALLEESLERRFDAAFGVERSESDRDALLVQRLERTEADLAALGDAYAELDIRTEREARLEQQLRDAGIEPWQLPEGE
ncbi:hypothetical protein ACQ4N7_28475 [Nodosilinea sp. AN01ver1]|uniref:hypothetical protein n=1 Tax=Nodosilinea sp. AN01ver1 TaxID=3423362 RepID=UPI003D3191F4